MAMRRREWIKPLVIAFFSNCNDFAGMKHGVVTIIDTVVYSVKAPSMVVVFEALGRHVVGMEKGCLLSSVVLA